MLRDKEAFAKLVEEKTGEKVQSNWEAQFKSGESILSKSGLLCSFEKGLVFAEEKFGKLADVFTYPVSDISSFQIDGSGFRATLTLETDSGKVSLTGRDRSGLDRILADAGLNDSAEPAGKPAPPPKPEPISPPRAEAPPEKKAIMKSITMTSGDDAPTFVLETESGKVTLGAGEGENLLKSFFGENVSIESSTPAKGAEPEPVSSRTDDEIETLRRKEKLVEDLFDAIEDGEAGDVEDLLDRGAPLECRDREEQTPLIHAIDEDESEVARLLIERGADISAADEDGMTPLMYAAENDNLGMVRLLIEKGADVNARDRSDMRTALHRAEESKVLNALLTAGADLESRDDCGQTPLHLAAYMGEEEKVQFLLEHGADPDARDEDDLTPLGVAQEAGEEVCAAILEGKRKGGAGDSGEVEAVRQKAELQKELFSRVEYGEPEEVVRLLEKGAPLEALDSERKTPLIVACEGNDSATARMLIERGANVDAADEDGETALIKAAQYEMTDTVRLLIEKGANLDTRNEHGWTALTYAENLDVVKLLVAGKADPNARDSMGRTPLGHAASMGQDGKVQVLLEHGADPNLRDMTGSTALDIARQSGAEVVVALLEGSAKGGGSEDVEELRNKKKMFGELMGLIKDGYEESVGAILDKGAPLNGRDGYGKTPLIVACEQGQPAIAELLIRRGAELHVLDGEGETALWHAVEQDDMDCVRILLKNGADPNITNESFGQSMLVRTNDIGILGALIAGGANVDAPDNSGETPLACAARCGEEEKVRFLLENGADPTIRDENGKTPHDLAVEDGEKVVAAILKKRMGR